MPMGQNEVNGLQGLSHPLKLFLTLNKGILWVTSIIFQQQTGFHRNMLFSRREFQ